MMSLTPVVCLHPPPPTLLVLLWVTLTALDSPLRSRVMVRNDKLMTMKKTGLQYALRTSEMGTGKSILQFTTTTPTPTPQPQAVLN